ncbi:hypothetical protein [Paenibacillus lemnae]|nr:hypothetical protein [Paenibacillus lemnae]
MEFLSSTFYLFLDEYARSSGENETILDQRQRSEDGSQSKWTSR